MSACRRVSDFNRPLFRYLPSNNRVDNNVTWDFMLARQVLLLHENAVRAGHGGHLLGQAGPGQTGHTMPASDVHLQSGQYLPQGYYGTQNKQNLESDGSGSADFNDPSTSDYGKVDKG